MGLREKIVSFFRMDDLKNASTLKLSDADFIRIMIDGMSEQKSDLSQITYNTCLRLLSESVSKLPLRMFKSTNEGLIKVTDHPTYKVLNRPNPYTSPSSFWSTVELNRNHYGNAYVYIDRNPNGSLKYLWILPSKDVTVYFSDNGVFQQENAVWYKYVDSQTLQEKWIHSDQMLHFKTSMTFNGLIGMPMRDILATYLDNGKKSADYLNNYYKGGLLGKAYLAYNDVLGLSKTDAQKFAQQMESYAGGVTNVSRIPVVPAGFDLKTMNMSMVDSQFLEISKYTALQIASAFGIKPSMLNDYDKGNYANVETQQRDFYVNTLLAILVAYEDELSYKLLLDREINDGYKFEFNPNAILRADYQTQMNGLTAGVNAGIFSRNEARDQLGFPSKQGNADELLVNSANVKVDEVANPQAPKGGG